MGSFNLAWLCSIVGFGLLTGAVIWLESEPAGLLGLGRLPTLVVGVWVLGFGSTALVVLYERTLRERLVKSARREAERDSIHRIAEVAAHELAQPLTVVMAYAQWLRRGASSSGESRYYLEQMAAGCHEMSVILRNLYETVRHSRAQVGTTILDEPAPMGEGLASGREEDLSPSGGQGHRGRSGTDSGWAASPRGRRTEATGALDQDEVSGADSPAVGAGRRRV